MAFDLNKNGAEKKKFDLSKAANEGPSNNANGSPFSNNEKKKSKVWIFLVIGVAVVGVIIWLIKSNNDSNISSNQPITEIVASDSAIVKDGKSETVIPEDSSIATSTVESAVTGNSETKVSEEDTKESAIGGTTLANSVSIPYKKEVTYKVYQFPFGAADLSQSSPELDELINILKQNSSVKISIFAYTDKIGSADFNQVLSDRRAQAIMNYIVSKGINSNRVKCQGKGISTKFKTNAENRRVEFVIS